MNTKQKHDDHEPNDFCGMGIQFEINAEFNETLTRTAHIAEHSKRSKTAASRSLKTVPSLETVKQR
ncbi:hypothetical protein L4D77_12590 [Photobacterium frigidiphilum]|uniref:hypothetical protein n=1 Tax=Photobacterium frigidiphilum TaxID=264736 RepID=UPI0002DD1A6F|nr:hypothetical protein [Photobacterium profundum]